jgi:putative ABC transport system permease protein
VGSLALLVAFLLAAPALLRGGAAALAPLLARTCGVPGRLAADEMRRHPRRAALPAAALGFGLALVVENLGVVTSLSRGTSEWMEENVAGDAFVSSGQTVMRAGGHALLDASLADDLAAVPGVRAVVGVRFLRPPWRGTRIFLLAVDVGPYRRMARLRIDAAGRERDDVLAEVARGEACLVSENFAALHGVGLGDVVDVPAADGSIPLRVVGLFPDYTWPRGTVFLDRSLVESRLGDRAVDEFSVALEPGADLRDVAPRLEAALGEGRDAVVTSAAELRAAARELLDDFFALAYAQVAAALAVAFLGVFNSLWMAVLLRRRELGLFRAVGATRGQLTASIVLQAAVLGAIGGIYGVLGGVAIQWMALRRVLLEDTGWWTRFDVPWGAAGAVVALGVATSALAGLWPARHASRLDLRDALGSE